MNIEIFSFTKVKDLVEAELQYLKRLQGDLSLKVTVLSQSKIKATPTLILADEAKELLSHLRPTQYLIILDEYGSQMTSKGFAELLQKHRNQSTGELVFAIGGPYGWDDSIRKRANATFSLSKLTFPAHVAKFLLIEQLYRAMTIINGHPYHK
ncbi:MAG: 23S rRNA (pseudouridine(1915)-N(3))-methyltransferase RlmH [Bdellovibrionota bacterium]|jgi:23S rRNA (pseudouridine1915-N3)-methyltransferase